MCNKSSKCWNLCKNSQPFKKYCMIINLLRWWLITLPTMINFPHAGITQICLIQGTYEYGKQLLQAGLVLRRSLRFDLTPNNERAQQLEEAWKYFSQGTNERANRLTVAAMFLSSAEKVWFAFCHPVYSFVFVQSYFHSIKIKNWFAQSFQVIPSWLHLNAKKLLL